MLFRLEEKQVVTQENVFVAENAMVIGDVKLGRESSVWFNAVIRGDNEWIQVGPETNIQESCVLHVDPGFPMTLGRGVTVGHGATLHGCLIGDFSLVGIGAVVLNGAQLGSYCLIGANTLIPEGMVVPDGSLVLGSPGKIRRSLTDEERVNLEESAAHYVKKAKLYRSSLEQMK